MGRHKKAAPLLQVHVKLTFQREFQGDAIFGFEKDQHRCSRYLFRNLKRALRFHEKRAIASKASDSAAVDSKKAGSFSLSQITRQSQSFGRTSSHSSFPDVSEASAPQDNDFPTFAEYVKDKTVSLYVSPFKPKQELLVDITHLRAKPGSVRTPGSLAIQSSKCCITFLILDWNAKSLHPVAEQNRECTLIMDPITKDMKVNMEQPFKFGIELSLGCRYQTQIRLSPAEDSTSSWPPVQPTSRMAKTSLSLLAKHHLETFPDGLFAIYTDLPLDRRPHKHVPLMYARGRAAYETLYRAEISIDWVVSPPQLLTQTVRQSSNTETSTRRVRVPTLKAKELSNSSPMLAGPIRVITSYTLAPHIDEYKKLALTTPELRNVSFRGFHCPFCLRKHSDFDDIVALRFHLSTAHATHKFALQELKSSARGRETITHAFQVSTATRKTEKVTARGSLTWVTPDVPFNVSAYIDGDESWLGAKPPPSTKGPVVIAEDPIVGLRRKHNGFLPVQYVREIPVRQRKKYRVVPTKTRDKLPLFTSVTHRKLQPDEELSESDDDVDESWLRDKHAQQIMDMTELPLDEREFQIRWNDHLRSEGSPHTFYWSDVFVRWVRRDRDWLKEKRERLMIYHRFERRLRDRGVLSDGVARGCWGILYKKATEGNRESGTAGTVAGTVAVAETRTNGV